MTRILTVFCALFFAAVLPVAAKAYTIAPGDVLQVEVLEDSSLNRSVLVLPDGTVNFPGAGSVRAAGLSVESVRAALSNALASQFAVPPTVYASVAQLGLASAAAAEEEPSLVFVMGEINGPGAIDVREGVTLLQAIAQAGGFTRFAATKRVELHRMDPANQSEQVFVFDYKNGTGISGGTLLIDGDVIVIPERRLFE